VSSAAALARFYLVNTFACASFSSVSASSVASSVRAMSASECAKLRLACFAGIGVW
jgi:hypothetical protein